MNKFLKNMAIGSVWTLLAVVIVISWFASPLPAPFPPELFDWDLED